MSTTAVMVAILVFLVLIFIVLFNQLVKLRNQFENAFAQISVQLQRRYELIPNLVEVASAYMQHENDTLTAVTQTRNMATHCCADASANPADGSLVGALSSAESLLNGAMGRLNMVMENYPDLKANANMRDLHEELLSTENRVAFSRQAFNDAVMRYNTYREQFPAVFVANALSFKAASFFVIEDESARQSVQVSFAQSRAT